MSEKVKCIIDGKACKFTIEEELAYANDRWIGGRSETRWTEKRVLKTRKGAYILAIYQLSMWQGEGMTEKYMVYDTLDELAQNLDPTESLDREILEQIGLLDALSVEV